MPVLTPDERRGAVLVALILTLGAGVDAWRACTPNTPVAKPPARLYGVPAAPTTPNYASDSASARAVTHPAAAQGAAAVVDLNRATPQELDRLPGIGPVLAARIVAHREAHGPFRRPEELLAVRGIGPRLLDRIRDRVTVARPP